MRAGARPAAAGLAALVTFGALVAGSGGCDPKKAAPETPDAADAGAQLVVDLPGCHPVIGGGTALAGLTPGPLSVVAANGKALVVSSSTRAAGVVLGPTGAAESPAFVIAAAPADAGAEAPPTLASALALGSELSTLTYAVRRATAADCADAVLATTSTAPGAARRELLPHACRQASSLRAATHGKLAIALATSPAVAPSVEAWLLDGTEAKPALLETFGPVTGKEAKDAGPTGPATVESPAVAAGSSSVAAAYVVHRGSASELHVARLGGPGGPPARVEVLDKEHIGTVALAFEDDTLHVVWSSFVPEKRRFVLRWSKWPAGGAPTAAQSIGTGVLSATKPSLAIDHGRFLLAWTEGEDRSSTVKVGASRRGIAPISGLATVVSSAGVIAEAPAVAIDNDALFVAWLERGAAEPSARAAALKCRE